MRQGVRHRGCERLGRLARPPAPAERSFAKPRGPRKRPTEAPDSGDADTLGARPSTPESEESGDVRRVHQAGEDEMVSIHSRLRRVGRLPPCKWREFEVNSERFREPFQRPVVRQAADPPILAKPLKT